MMMNPSRQRRSEYIVQHLRQQMAAGALRPGHRLPTEHALCTTYGVSRTTLREAVNALRNQGLLDVAPGRGTFVCMPSLTHLAADITLMARLVETDEGEMAALRHALLRLVVPHVARADVGAKQALGDAMLHPGQTPEDNAAAEAGWQIHLMRLAPMPCAQLMLEIVLAMDAATRLQRCADAAYVQRVQHVQMRGVQAVTLGDSAALERVLGTWLCPEGVALAA